ncbi:hypothetical protein [Streptomyces sp. NPDC003832]
MYLPAAERAGAFPAVAVGESGSCWSGEEALRGGSRKGLKVCNFEPVTLHATGAPVMVIR